MAYLDEIADRNVIPTEEALTNLKHFRAVMPIEHTDASEVIDLLKIIAFDERDFNS